MQQDKFNRIFGIPAIRDHFREYKAIYLFALVWFLINLLQAAFTEIFEDEAYYWLYSEFPAWGYFDHPPMIAILIKLGYGIFPNTLGVRLFPVLLGSGTVLITWFLIPERSRNFRVFAWSVFGMSLMHLHTAGFIGLPDIPLVFFTALFFLLMRDYLESDRMGRAILLGIVVAGMVYSKYHALLILFFTLIACWKLILRRSFWVIVLVATTLYLPHIIWQFKNDFVSFQYHLISRNDPFNARHILEYIGNQLLVTGPFVGVFLLYLAFAGKATRPFERMLKFNLIGIFGFFLLSSVLGHVEPHWTAAVFPPLIVLALVNLGTHPRLEKWLKILGIASIPVILIIRVYLVWDFLPLPGNRAKAFHGKDIWTKQVAEVTGERPVVFLNKYQNASVYWFYTGKKAFTRNDILYRRNQFDLWPMEEQLEGRPVLLMGWGKSDSTLNLPTVIGDIPYYEIERYCSFNRLRIEIPEKKISTGPGSTLALSIRLSNPTSRDVALDCECDLPPLLMYSYQIRERRTNRRITSSYVLEPQPRIGNLSPGETIQLDLELTAPEDPDQYELWISFGSRILHPGINGSPGQLTVREAPAD